MQFEKFDLGHLNLSVTGLDFHQLSELDDITTYVVTVISVSSLHLQVEITNLWHSIQRNHRNLYRLSLSIETKNISLLLVLPPVALKVPNCSYHIELDLQQPSGEYFTFVLFSASITFGFKLRKCTLPIFPAFRKCFKCSPTAFVIQFQHLHFMNWNHRTLRNSFIVKLVVSYQVLGVHLDIQNIIWTW